MSENTFMKLYREATLPQNGTLYGGSYPEASEADVMEAFMAYAEANANMERNAMLYAESAQDLMNSKGLSVVGAIMYAEGEGGFFKKILNAIIKLYEKAKDFIIKLLGRVKSNKAYRTDLIFIKEALGKMENIKALNEDDSFKYKEIQYNAISKLIMGTIGSDGESKTLLQTKFTGDINIDNLTEAVSKVAKLSATDKDGNTTVTKENIDDVVKKFEAIRSDANLRDSEKILKTFYKTAVGDADVGKAKFSPDEAMKAAECVNALWEGNDETAKGTSEIKQIASTIKAAYEAIKFEQIEGALDKGVKDYKKKVDDLKNIVNKMSDTYTTVFNDRDAKDGAAKDGAKDLMSIASQYSTFMTDLSTAVVTAFNTGKIQLDKFIAYGKGLASSIDKLKNVTTA